MSEDKTLSPAEIRQRTDDLLNTITGLGGWRDKSNYSVAVKRAYMEANELEALYEQNAMAAKIVDRVVQDCMRGDYFTITGEDTDFDFSSVQSQLEDLNATNRLGESWRWARLYGGSICVMLVDDGLPLDRPLNLKRANKLLGLQPIESRYVIPNTWDPGLGNMAFGLPRYYEVFLPFGDVNNGTKIHWSRVLRFDGIDLPPTRQIQNGGWGPSCLERSKRAITGLTMAMKNAENVMNDITMQVIKIKNLREKLQGGEQSKEEVRQVFELLKANMDNLHLLVLDQEDTLEEHSRTVTGIAELIDRHSDQIVRDTIYTRSVLLGEQPRGGLNSTGQTEIDVYFSNCESEQERNLRHPLERLLHVIFTLRAKTEDVPEEWHIDFAPLKVKDINETAEAQLKTAQADQIYYDMGVVSADEIRQREISEGNITPFEGEEEVMPPQPQPETFEVEQEETPGELESGEGLGL